MNLSVRVEGMARLQKLLTGPDLYWDPWRRGMQALASKGGLEGQRAAPVLRGKLQRRTYGAIQKRPLPLWVAVRVRARGPRTTKHPKGFAYGRLLEYSRKHGHFGWFSTAVKRIWSDAGQTLNHIAQGIAQNWSRG